MTFVFFGYVTDADFCLAGAPRYLKLVTSFNFWPFMIISALMLFVLLVMILLFFVLFCFWC